MNCPACGEKDTSVLETRRDVCGGTDVQRRHACECGARWSSLQRFVKGTLQIAGTTGRRSSQAPGTVDDPPSKPGRPTDAFVLSLSGSDPGSSPDSSKPNNNNPNKMGPKYTPAFELAWKAYPRREEKATAFVAWQAAARANGGEDNLCALVLAALAWQVPMCWSGENARFAKYFERYLKKRKWEDERPTTTAQREQYARLG